MAEQKTRTATERLADAENALMAVYQVVNQATNDLTLAKEALKLLGSKVEALAQLSNLSNEQINAKMVQNSAQKLKDIVDSFVSDGSLTLSSEGAGADSFVVAREIDENGAEVNPRIQFGVRHIQDSMKSKVLGVKPGSSIPLNDENTIFLNILEIYEPRPAASVAAPAAVNELTDEVASDGSTATETVAS